MLSFFRQLAERTESSSSSTLRSRFGLNGSSGRRSCGTFGCGSSKLMNGCELVLEDAGAERHRIVRAHRTVGLDGHDQPVIVGLLADAGIVDAIGHLAHRAVDRIDGDQADRRVLGLVEVRRDVALAARDGQLHRDLAALVDMGDHLVGSMISTSWPVSIIPPVTTFGPSALR
jgi:hypothetical protein